MDELVARLRAAGCVFAEDEAAILRTAAADGGHLESLVRDRVSGTPLEYVVGWADFAGIRVPVEPGVFVPRPRSELLVDVVAGVVEAEDLLLDLCCGTGAIAAAVAARVDVRVVAADSHPLAIANARRTLAPVGGLVVESNLFDAVPATLKGEFAVIAVVAPYVPSAAIELLPREARDYEPRSALDGGVDGLEVVRRIVGSARDWLRPGGMLATEVGDDQWETVVVLAHDAGLVAEVIDDDGAIVVTARSA
jgi:release factor glutamine methyltransferase